MITSAQLKAARAMLGIDQKTLAELAGVSVPTVQRMETSPGNVRGTIESLTRIIEALDRAGVELISEDMKSNAVGRGVRLKQAVGTMSAKARPRDLKAGHVSS
jgi:predicted transcriptional regulator